MVWTKHSFRIMITLSIIQGEWEMRLGCCMFLSAWGGDLCGTMQKYRDAGIEYIELPVTELVSMEEAAFSELCQQFEQAPIRCEGVNVLFPGTLRLIGEDVDQGAVTAHLDKTFDRLSRLGVDIVVFGSGKAKEIPEGFPRQRAEEQLLELLHTLGSYASRYGNTVVLEALNTGECNFVTSVAESYGFVKQVNHPRVKLLVDYYHMVTNGEDESILDCLGADLCHMHFADPNGRTFPVPQNQERYRAFFSHIKKIGYTGRLSMETSSKDRLGDSEKYLPVLQEIL